MVSDKTYKKASGLASRAMRTGDVPWRLAPTLHVLLGQGYDPISGPRQAQPLYGQLLDYVRVACLQQRNVVGPARTRGFEGCNLALQRRCALDKP